MKKKREGERETEGKEDNNFLVTSMFKMPHIFPLTL